MHPLISTTELAAALTDPLRAARLRLFDTAQHLKAGASGGFVGESAAADFDAAHLPGAAYLDLQRDFSDNASALRFALPEVEALRAAFGAAGIGLQTEVVLYASNHPMWATRFWWMLRSLGIEARVLDGGLAQWRAEGRAVESGPPSRPYPPTQFVARPQAGHWADKAEVMRAMSDGAVCTINALSAAVHAGHSAVHYGRPGHIAGSLNVPFSELQQPDGRFKAPPELRAALESGGALSRPRAICYCGGGIAATMTALGLVLCGRTEVAVYDASLQEWAMDPSAPMQTTARPEFQ